MLANNADLTAVTNIDPEQELLRKESINLVNSALQKMPSLYQDIIYLYYFQNYSYQEIATTLKINIRTVETRLYRARKMLQMIVLESSIS